MDIIPMDIITINFNGYYTINYNGYYYNGHFYNRLQWM